MQLIANQDTHILVTMAEPICRGKPVEFSPFTLCGIPNDHDSKLRLCTDEPMVTVHPQVCHGLDADTTVRDGNQFTVGDKITIDIYGSVPHGGGHCTFWYSTDDATFTKIIDIKDCTLNGAEVILPETMPAECEERCTFAFSWVPVNSGACEIYMNCADISVSGASGGICTFDLSSFFITFHPLHYALSTAQAIPTRSPRVPNTFSFVICVTIHHE